MNKRAQISFFMLIGIVIVVIFILIFHLKSLGPSEVNLNKIQAESIKDYVDSCVELTTKHAIINLGLQGGFIGIPSNVQTLTLKQSPPMQVVYLYDYDNYKSSLTFNVLNSITEWQDELSSYIQNNLPVCINGFQPFEQQGYDIKSGTPKADVKIRSKDVLVTLNYPLEIRKGKTKEEMKNFQVRAGINLNAVHNQAENILNAIDSSDWEGDIEPARAFCKERNTLGKFCPQQSINFNFKIDKYLPFDYDFVDPTSTEPSIEPRTTLWVIKTNFRTRESFYFVFAARHKYQHIIPS